MIFEARSGFFENVPRVPRAMMRSDPGNTCCCRLSAAPGLPDPWGNCTRVISRTKLGNPLLMCSITHGNVSIHTTNLSLFYSSSFTFLEMTQPKGLKNCLCSCIFSEKRVKHTFISFGDEIFLSYCDMTAVMIQSNKKVSNDIKGKYARPVPIDLGGTRQRNEGGGPN